MALHKYFFIKSEPKAWGKILLFGGKLLYSRISGWGKAAIQQRSYILPRFFFGASLQNYAPWKKIRKRINSYVATRVLQSRGAAIRNTDRNPDPALFRSDGVNLSPLGNILINSLLRSLDTLIVFGNSIYST